MSSKQKKMIVKDLEHACAYDLDDQWYHLAQEDYLNTARIFNNDKDSASESFFGTYKFDIWDTLPSSCSQGKLLAYLAASTKQKEIPF